MYLTSCSARVELPPRSLEVLAVPAGAAVQAQASVDGNHVDYRYAWDDSTLWLYTPQGDYAFDCRRREPARAAGSDGNTATHVHAAINGRVVDVAVARGQDVVRGDRLVVLEAMKMEHEVRATRAGRIAEIGVGTGEQVVPGQVLIRYEGEPA